MDNLIPWSRFYSLATIALLLGAWNAATPESIRYNPASRDVIEARLQKYKGNDEQREAALKQLFAEAGCDEQHLSEQRVKGSKLPNVVCVLPGSSGNVIRETARYVDTVHPACPPVECQNVRDCQGLLLFNSVQFGVSGGTR